MTLTASEGPVCALCHKQRPIRDSHLIPAALYKLVRRANEEEEDGNPDPVHITQEAAWQSSKQMTGDLLCSECENRFSRMGEKYVVASALRTGSHFPLADLIDEAAPIHVNPERAIYAVDDIEGLDVDKLVYFAASVFWRAGARRWSVSQSKKVRLSLGRYSENLRLFLLGETPFPEDIAIQFFVDRERFARFMGPPVGGKAGQCHRYAFMIPGMQFVMYVGKGIPEDQRAVAFRSGGLLSYTDLKHSSIVQGTIESMRDAWSSMKLRVKTG